MLEIDITAESVTGGGSSSPDVVAPRVQLIGYTSYIPPLDVDAVSPAGALQLEPLPGATASESIIEFAGRGCYRSWDRPNPKTATISGYLSNIISQKHLSVLRHSSASFYITGVSRTFTHELVTHAHIARSQESQRFVRADDINMVVPPLIRELVADTAVDGDSGAQRCMDQLADTVRITRNLYKEYVEMLEQIGLKGKKSREAARAVLTNCVETRLTVTANYQAWLEFLVKRHNPHADAEMQEVTGMIYQHLITLAPNIFAPEVRDLWDQSFAERRATESETNS